MLFPQLGPQYYGENNKAILSRMEAFYAEAISINQSFWGEADIDTRFEAGDQSVLNDLYGNLPANAGRQFSFNRIRRVINMIDGYQRRNRKSTIVTPVENGDAVTADQFTKLLMWINQRENVLETISDAFHGSLVTGMNLMQVWIDYRSDPVSGNIKVDNCNYNSFLIDPYFRKQDLSDCNGLWKRSFLTKRECISLLPDHEDEIIGLSGNDTRDNKFQFIPENYNYGMKNLLAYDEFYYRDYRSQLMLVDSQTGETMEWKGKEKSALKAFLQMYPQVTTVKQDIPTVRVAIVVQGKVMYDGPNPLGIDQYPFVPVFSYYNPQIPYFPIRVQGVVRGLRDAQYLYNRRKVIELDNLESTVNSGWIYKENALVDPKSVFMTGQGRGIAVKAEAQMTDVQQIQSPQVPPTTIQLSEILAKEVQEISGINEELLGSAVDDKAGILAMLRQGAGLTTLQILFDRLDCSQKLLGKLMIDTIQANFTPGKVKRIIEEEPTPQFYNKAFGSYDAAVEEGLNTTTQRQMQFAQLLHLREAGVNVPDEVLLEASTMQNKKDLMEAIEAQNQAQQQAEQEEKQVAMQEQQARTELAQARAIADRGLGLERVNRVVTNETQAIENLAEAQQSREAGYLNLIKSLKELDEMDLNQIQRLLEIDRYIKEQKTEAKGEKREQEEAVRTKMQTAVQAAQRSPGQMAGRAQQGMKPEQNITV